MSQKPSSEVDRTDEEPRGMGRRECLKLGGAGLGASMLGLPVGSTQSALAGEASSSSSDYLNLADEVPDEAMDLWEDKPDVRQEFDTVDASDYDGRSGDLADLIEQASSQNAIVDLGSGTYEMESTVTGDGDVVGVVGDGPGAATIYYQGTSLDYLFQIRNVSAGVMEGVTFDITEDAGGNNTDVGLLDGQFDDEFWAEDVVFRGQRHRWQDLNGDGNYTSVGGRFTFLVNMTQSDAEAFIHRCEFPDGGTDVTHETGSGVGHAIGPNADPPHEGLNVWKECYCSGFIDNGFYVSNSPGRNVLWDCHAEDNATGNMRISYNDYVVGGVSEVHDLPGDRLGQCLTHDRGDNVKVVGLECRGTGDSYGAEVIQVRTEAEELELDRVVVHTDGHNRPVRLSSDGSGPNVQIDITDCYWYDEADGIPMVEILRADVTADADWRVLSEGRDEITIDSSASLTYDGQTYSSGTYTASDLGMEDPRQFGGDLPDFYFDYGDGDGDFTVDAGVFGEDGATTDNYRYNVTELQALTATPDGVGFDSNHRSQETDVYQGIQVEPHTSLSGFRVQIDPDASGITHATIRDTDGNVLADTDVSDLSPGDYAEIRHDLSAGTKYWVQLGNHGNEYTRGSSSASYPIERDEFTVDYGVFNQWGSISENNRYNVTEIEAITDDVGGSVGFGSNHRSEDVSAYQGVLVEPNVPLDGVRLQIDPETSNITHATIRDTGGTILAEADVSYLDPGDYVDVHYDLSAGTEYMIVLGNHGNTYTRGASGESYPQTSN